MEAVAYELGSSFMRSHVFFRGLFQGSVKTSILPLMCGSIGISHNALALKHLESLGTKQGSNPCSGTMLL